MKPTEIIRTTTLKKGRVSTTVNLFMLDTEIFDSLVLAYVRGEVDIIETRVATVFKHPQDKYDKSVAKAEAYKRLVKDRLKIISIRSSLQGTTILTSEFKLVRFRESGRIIIKKAL